MQSLSLALMAWGFVKKHRAIITKVVAIGGVIIAAYGFIYGQGYRKAEQRYLNQIRATELANDRAIEKADKAYSAQIVILNTRNRELKNALAENAAKRAVDPRGAEPGLGVDSVRRLNRIR